MNASIIAIELRRVIRAFEQRHSIGANVFSVAESSRSMVDIYHDNPSCVDYFNAALKSYRSQMEIVMVKQHDTGFFVYLDHVDKDAYGAWDVLKMQWVESDWDYPGLHVNPSFDAIKDEPSFEDIRDMVIERTPLKPFMTFYGTDDHAQES